MDKFNFNGGLMVYHIDERAQINNEGHPGQSGWPANGNHYACSILPRDGAYDLEKGSNYGDANDLFRNGDELGPNGVSFNGEQSSAYPNTDSYQYGNIESTGHTIFGIDVKADGSIDFNYCNGCDPSTFGGGPVSSPTNPPPTPVPPTPGESFACLFLHGWNLNLCYFFKTSFSSKYNLNIFVHVCCRPQKFIVPPTPVPPTPVPPTPVPPTPVPPTPGKNLFFLRKFR